MQRAGRKRLYDVEDIVSKRITNSGKTEYKVQWMGFKSKSWEPVDNLQDCTELIARYEESAARENRNPIAASTAKNRAKSMVKERPVRLQEQCVAKDHGLISNGKYENDSNIQQEEKRQATRISSNSNRSKSMVKERPVYQSGRSSKTSVTTIPKSNSKWKNRDEAERGKDTTKQNSKVNVGTQTNAQIVTMRIPAKHFDQTAENITTLAQERGSSVHQLNKDVVNNGRNITGIKFGQENCPIQ
ncbi:chromo (CHRromatin organization MOdifier) domain-containing protein [Ditylenchus destructor]|nr:chromo (CHRromatin organization MOdifier) domain-containing protein [Ditylenchus destructor]